MTIEVENEKILRSIARWIAGLKPKWGKTFYFQRFAWWQCVVDRFLNDCRHYMSRGTCPFCGKRIGRRNMVWHILKSHRYQILEVIRVCREGSL